ncbi:MAG: hypothetical protein VX186_00010 [Nitrospinota bacterium]|nr:hypothetical protein [Nitrospinota bacterium]
MFWIDLGLLGITAYRMVGALKAVFTVAEKLALAFLFALGLKSLILFFLIWMGVRPFASIQIGAVVLVLILTLLLTGPVTGSAPVASSPNAEWKTVLVCLLIGALFLFSLVNAWFFPITESDAVWYQVKGLSFLHEVRFDSDWVVPQLRQYPPFVPLLFSWFIAFGIEPMRMIFPFFYLALNTIFYCRVLEFTGNSKMAAMLTLVLGTTPYIWWHGVLPFLDLCAAVFYSAGALYWFFWMESLGVDQEKGRCRTLAFLSGLFFGLSAWTRLEFLLYCLIPIAMTFCAESTLRKDGERDRKSFLLFFLSLLVFPTSWFLNLASFDFSISGNVKMVGLAGVFAWIIVLIFIMGSWKLKVSTLIKTGLLAGMIFIIFISMDNSGPVPGWKKLSIAFYRSLTVHGFYLFTVFLSVFIFFSRLKNIPSLNKLFGMFLVFYPLVHFAIFSYSPPKWETFGEYVSATFIYPGNLVNLSDTRGVMSMYPLLLFFIASIPSIRRGFDDV